MAVLKQFCKGETIKVTVMPDEGMTMGNPVMYVYPDSLVLSNETTGSAKIIRIPSSGVQQAQDDGSYVFSISSAITRNDMPAGDYTIELKYGSTEISIVKQSRAFTLVDSGYDVKEEATNS